MTTTQAMIDAGLVALRAWLPNEFEEDARMVQAIYEAMDAVKEEETGHLTHIQ